METYKQALMLAVSAVLLALLTGKTLRRLLLLPLKLLAKKTDTEEDDELVNEAARDLGLDPDAGVPPNPAQTLSQHSAPGPTEHSCDPDTHNEESK